MGKCINRRRNGDKEVKQQVMEMTRLTACGLFVGLALSACQPNTGENERSEEHTSELQSLMRISYAVFCLKKNNMKLLEITTLSSKHRHTICYHQYIATN